MDMTPSCAKTLPPARPGTFLSDVLSGLSVRPRSLPCKYFYDLEGSRLFDRICELDAYYPTRTEAAILRDRGAEMAGVLGERVVLVEPGAGSGTKTRILLDHLRDTVAYVPVDISGEHLAEAASALARDYPALPVLPVVADFTRPFELPAPPRPAARTVVFFPGSTIGNFEAEPARAFLAHLGEIAGPDGRVLVGADLHKDAATLERAYDDELGVTAAFNKNLLARINRELGGTFDLDAFAHRARYEVGPMRVRIELVSLRAQTVAVAGRSFDFAEGEPIHTEFAHKYTLESFAELARGGGLRVERVWTDGADRFSVQCLAPA